MSVTTFGAKGVVLLNLHLISLACALATCATTAFSSTMQVDLSGVANGSWCDADGIRLFGCTSLPVGQQTLNGTAFDIAGGNGANNAWFSSVAADNGSGKVSVTIPVNIAGARSVNTLLNTFWGQSGTSYDTITFTGSNGATHSVSLTGNNSLRDYNSYIWTNSLATPGIAANAWNNYSQGGRQRLDEQQFVLPGDFSSQTLDSITITDAGGGTFSRAFLAGLTVVTADVSPNAAAVPEPSSLFIFGGALLGAGLLFRRKRR